MSKVYYPGCKGIWYSESSTHGNFEHVLYASEDRYVWHYLDALLSRRRLGPTKIWKDCFEEMDDYFLPTASLVLPMEFLE